jgi:hypothetical protein
VEAGSESGRAEDLAINPAAIAPKGSAKPMTSQTMTHTV